MKQPTSNTVHWVKQELGAFFGWSSIKHSEANLHVMQLQTNAFTIRTENILYATVRVWYNPYKVIVSQSIQIQVKHYHLIW